MGHFNPNKDSIAWNLYRRAWLVPAVAFALVLITGFQLEPVSQSGSLPPTIQNEQAAELLTEANSFSKRFPDRRPGTRGSVDSAYWMREQFQALDLSAKAVPASTVNPANNRSISIMNVEASLPGRTEDTVVIMAHRDTADANGSGGDASGQIALLSLAREINATRDRRRSYLFVSTDAATMNGAGARVLAERLAKKTVTAVIVIDRLDAGKQPRIDDAASGTFAAPIGLTQLGRESLKAEGVSAPQAKILDQVTQLAAPVTLREHGQLLERGLAAITITGGDDQLRESGEKSADSTQATSAVGAGLRAVQRTTSTIDQLDRIHTVGKTWVASERRAYRGWAIKLFIASLLVPVWVVVVEQIVKRRNGWNLAAMIGTSARAMLAGVAAVALLWLFGAIGILAHASDRPPNPFVIDGARTFGIWLWLLFALGAWLIARGPDWRREQQQLFPAKTNSGDSAITLLILTVLAGVTLAINSYTVLFAVPALHAWIWLCSERVASARPRILVWSAGLFGGLLVLMRIGASSDAGNGSLLYLFHLIQTRTVPPMLGLIIGMATGLSLLLLIAALGKVSNPMLPKLRELALYGEFSRLFAPLKRIGRKRPSFTLPGQRLRSRRVRSQALPGKGMPRRSRVQETSFVDTELSADRRRELEARERARRRAERTRTRNRHTR